jgi:hypothetical protein
MKTNTIIWIVLGLVVLLGGYLLLSNNSGAPATSTQTPTLNASPASAGINQIQPAAPASGNTYISTALMTEQGESGQSGTAIFSQNAAGNVVVTIELVGTPSTVPQPAHVHVGECPEPGAVKYPLANVVGGKSETVLDTTWSELLTGEEALAVNVHKSAAESTVYTACGNVPLAPAPAAPAPAN